MTLECMIALFREWYEISFSHVQETNPEKPSLSYLEMMIDSLMNIMISWPFGYRNECIFWNKLLNGFRDIASCQFDYWKQIDTVQSVFFRHSSISCYRKA